MLDQAHKLRQLIDTAPPSAHDTAPGPPMLVVSGGTAGVGATTVAVNLAAVLADRIQRVLVVDAAQQRASLGKVAGVQSRCEYSWPDVLAGRCTIADAIVPGPAGTLLLTNHSQRGPKSNFSRKAQHHLICELQSLHDDVDLLIIDAGSGLTPWAKRFWQRSRLVVLVTSTDYAALMDAYGAIKLHSADAHDALPGNIRVLINRCDCDRTAAEVQSRLQQCCRRFLGHSVSTLPALPRCVMHEDGSESFCTRVWESPNSPFGQAALWLGRAVTDFLHNANPNPRITACGAGSHTPSLTTLLAAEPSHRRRSKQCHIAH
jgi:flagellar biosynthesis protein FlhG